MKSNNEEKKRKRPVKWPPAMQVGYSYLKSTFRLPYA